MFFWSNFQMKLRWLEKNKQSEEKQKKSWFVFSFVEKHVKLTSQRFSGFSPKFYSIYTTQICQKLSPSSRFLFLAKKSFLVFNRAKSSFQRWMKKTFKLVVCFALLLFRSVELLTFYLIFVTTTTRLSTESEMEKTS